MIRRIGKALAIVAGLLLIIADVQRRDNSNDLSEHQPAAEQVSSGAR